MDIDAVGTLDKVLPEVVIPNFSLEAIRSVAPAAILIALVAYVESIALAQHFAAKHRYQISPNRELIALGSANVVSSLVGGLAVGAGFSRSAIHESNGAKTKKAGIASGIVVIVVLLGASKLLPFIPYAALASIVFWASLRLVNVKRIVQLYRFFRRDFMLFGIACLGVLFLGIEYGLGMAILVQALMYPWKREPLQLEQHDRDLHVRGELNYVEAIALIKAIQEHNIQRVHCEGIDNIDAGAIIELEKLSHIQWLGWSGALIPKLSAVLVQPKLPHTQ